MFGWSPCKLDKVAMPSSGGWLKTSSFSQNWICSAISSIVVTLFQFLAVPLLFRTRAVIAGNFDRPTLFG
jgi:hypothetical protein